MDLDRHVPRDSPIHRFDPRLKLVLAVAAILAITLLPAGSYVAFLVAWLCTVMLSVSARLGPGRLVRGSVIVLPFAIVALPLIFTRPGEPVFSIDLGPLELTATQEGIRDALSIVLRSWLSVQVALLLAFTTPFPTLIDALRALRIPALIVSIISFMYRYLAVIGEEAGRLNRARVSRSVGRGANGLGGLVWRARVTGGMIGSLFVRSYERSERVYAAMLSRGFTGTLPRQAMAGPTRGEMLAFGATLAVIVVFLALVTRWGPVW
jgi:cobalt/nickel transport system permease protein